jgi:hypothetical protein
MSEFEAFRSVGFTHNGRHFRVPGDGTGTGNNCLFDSVLSSGLVSSCSPADFRAIVLNYHLPGHPGNSFATDSYRLFSRGTVSLNQYLHAMLSSPMMASDFEMLLISMQFGINIVSFSNEQSGIHVFDAFDFIK